ncbi:hypothetical protein L1987_81545 [Smallanthus sonchifolius]|uniref:Uncharacterized protein n=1 Tax=Smallanthus sonchifolius TaxID=185202 RepID=A0ACB8YQR3_9ASTR|nr:hypothetical protein L1987_81545 [Smallanthus sonchifolius]
MQRASFHEVTVGFQSIKTNRHHTRNIFHTPVEATPPIQFTPAQRNSRPKAYESTKRILFDTTVDLQCVLPYMRHHNSFIPAATRGWVQPS